MKFLFTISFSTLIKSVSILPSSHSISVHLLLCSSICDIIFSRVLKSFLFSSISLSLIKLLNSMWHLIIPSTAFLTSSLKTVISFVSLSVWKNFFWKFFSKIFSNFLLMYVFTSILFILPSRASISPFIFPYSVFSTFCIYLFSFPAFIFLVISSNFFCFSFICFFIFSFMSFWVSSSTTTTPALNSPIFSTSFSIFF